MKVDAAPAMIARGEIAAGVPAGTHEAALAKLV
jgi:hypothetical protein